MRNFLILSCFAFMIGGCNTNSSDSAAQEVVEEKKIVVSTSFYPLTHFAMQVGGDVVDVRQIASQGTDPHSYEPTPSQIKQIFESDLLIYNGEGQDPYADRIHKELEQKGTRVLIATQIVERMSYEKEDHHDHEMEEHDDNLKDHKGEDHDEHEDEDHDKHEDEHDEHNHGEWDPHVWLDPLRAEELIQKIAKEFSEIDPSNADLYMNNADAYSAKLRALDADMKEGLSDCSLDAIIVSHDAYRYLANRYDFYTFEIAGLSPSVQPSPARLAELTDVAKKEGIGHVFFETQVSPALSETLAQEIGAATLILHSIEALTVKEREENKTYIDLMRMNLANLRTALQCNE